MYFPGIYFCVDIYRIVLKDSMETEHIHSCMRVSTIGKSGGSHMS